MKKLLLILLVMIPLFGCSARGKAPLIYFHYSHSNTMVAGDFQEWTVDLENPKIAVVTIKKGFQESSYRTSSSILEEMGRIVKQYKMHRYKRQYVRKNVLDGWAWDCTLGYSGGKFIGSSGYMKYPSGARDAFNELTAFIEQWCSVPDSTKIKIFEYGRSNGMVLGHGESYSVQKEKDGLVRVAINEGKNGEMIFKTDSFKILEDLQKIVMDYGMYKFKGSYMPDTDIRDGDSWRINVYYEDPLYDISAHGYMAWPEGYHEAIDALNAYFEALRGQ